MKEIKNKVISGWGGYPLINSKIFYPENISDILKEISASDTSYIARGNGRAYGEAAINKDLTISMLKFNKIIEFNQSTGELIAESGVLLADVIKKFLKNGWFPFSCAGTKFITLGGAIAADIHGKNHHHEGSFGNYINWLEVIDKNGEILRCSKNDNDEIFNWTIGGMGLTGIITKCSINLRKVESGWINKKNIVNENLKQTLDSFEENISATYSVAWLDCLSSGNKLGRSILTLGEHCKKKDVHVKTTFPKARNYLMKLPLYFPSFILNNMTVKLFNKLYFLINSKKTTNEIVGWDSYFFPLDSIYDWNKMYGREGFFQLQFLIPEKLSFEAISKILKIMQSESSGSFLAVLKKFGFGNGHFSFPDKGYTLALDFKITDKNIQASRKLIAVVIDYDGKFYLAKDSILESSEFLESQHNEVKKFKKIRNSRVSSELSKRLNI